MICIAGGGRPALVRSFYSADETEYGPGTGPGSGLASTRTQQTVRWTRVRWGELGAQFRATALMYLERAAPPLRRRPSRRLLYTTGAGRSALFSARCGDWPIGC